MSTAPSAQPKKKRRVAQYLQNIKDSYTISRRTYPWIGWALLGITVALIALAVLIALATGMAVWYWTLMAIMVVLVADMALLSWTTPRAAYAQIEGQPGAAKAVLDRAARGWNLESEPVYVQPRTQELIWRMVGRPGVALIVEGNPNRLQQAITEQQRLLGRILSTVPVHVIVVGTGEGQTRLIDLQRTLRRLPTKPTRLTDTEISQVAKRLGSLSGKGLPIPKGIDPNKVRPDRRALRGR